ncbi:hemerythrin domain-containing protein [Clostridium cellulovorans]|uniref:Hemerythrin HHE cation binding domain protein n=1 Tax=Clostridium cellulovorans (strain ATCC 35296 / DSM 3052 / OCM 3 / 743B) TaxID=573061 RepID=D9SVD2_CLOC7|nr:hemerythrin domain-containing protein [Clostridium cellulovorans]ADL51056.1 Hemerythrin HHE cation binding domain protein [Clostridium cellulovorans 743B]
MNAIEIMVDEHRYIKRMLVVVRKLCIKIMNGEDVNFSDFYRVMDFVKNYADIHHHGKEEQLLFNRMLDETGKVAEKLIKSGMLVEHDLGRLYMADLRSALEKYEKGDEESKLDIISNAMGYTYLLKRHIEKEDEVVYKFAERSLSKETLAEIEVQCIEFEKKQSAEGIQTKYIALLEELEKKLK